VKADMTGCRAEVVVGRQERVTTSDGQLGDQGIDSADLNTSGAQRVAHARSGDVVFARGNEVLQRCDCLGDLRPGSLRNDALQQFLQD
jgi:hypothetical protein